MANQGQMHQNLVSETDLTDQKQTSEAREREPKINFLVNVLLS